MSSEMVERVARAIAPMMWDDGLCEHLTDQAILVARTAVLRQARAAVEAMRDPGFDLEQVSYHGGMTRRDWWQAMIDRALAP